jgi:uncharacterized repeat protein (TIGR03803 family)
LCGGVFFNQQMKTHIKRAFLALVLLAGLGSVLAGQLLAQTLTVLHSFTEGGGGAAPYARLILSANTLYGTTQHGGNSGKGTVFRISTDGTNFRTLYSFTPATGSNWDDLPMNSDGANPKAELTLMGTTLYGTATFGGTSGNGTVFAIDTDGTGFTNLHNFTEVQLFVAGGERMATNSDGVFPNGSLVLSGNTLYGTTFDAGSSGFGTLFAVNTDGTGFRVLHTFSRGDSYGPSGCLVLSGSTLYGTTQYGGSSGNGTVFRLSTDGTGFTTLYSFTEGSGSLPGGTNKDGAFPYSGLVLSGNALYGTALYGGTSGNGTVFAINTDGTGFATLHSFGAPLGADLTNSDGALPYSGLVLSEGTVYGTASGGGRSGWGTAFALNTDGTGFTNLHSFMAGGYDYQSNFTNSDGAWPNAGLLLSGNILYGTTVSGGSSGYGTVFRISLPVTPPQLAIRPSGANVTLTWPTNAVAFALQSTTNLSSATWTTNLSAPVVVDGQYTVTNPIPATQQFFRLSLRIDL